MDCKAGTLVWKLCHVCFDAVSKTEKYSQYGDASSAKVCSAYNWEKLMGKRAGKLKGGMNY